MKKHVQGTNVFEITCDFCKVRLYIEYPQEFGLGDIVGKQTKKWIYMRMDLIVNNFDISHFCSKDCEEEYEELN